MSSIANAYNPTAQMTILTERRGWFRCYAVAVIPGFSGHVQVGPFRSQRKAHRKMVRALAEAGIS